MNHWPYQYCRSRDLLPPQWARCRIERELPGGTYVIKLRRGGWVYGVHRRSLHHSIEFFTMQTPRVNASVWPSMPNFPGHTSIMGATQ